MALVVIFGKTNIKQCIWTFTRMCDNIWMYMYCIYTVYIYIYIYIYMYIIYTYIYLCKLGMQYVCAMYVWMCLGVWLIISVDLVNETVTKTFFSKALWLLV